MAIEIPEVDVTDDPARFEEAIAAMRRRVPVLDEDWELLTPPERELAFKVSKVIHAEMAVMAWEAVQHLLEDGGNLDTFADEVGEALEASWGGKRPGLLETVMRTNAMGAYQAGRYAQQSAPASKKRRPFLRMDPIDDHRISAFCEPFARETVIVEIDDPWWNENYPPRHFQALMPWTLIETSQGPKPISDVRVGDMVVTHRGRLRPVYATMSKRPDVKTFRRVKVSTGRELCITNEHPVLTARGWLRADDLKLGDKLFQHPQRSPRASERAVVDPQDFPSVVNEEFVPDEIALDPSLAPVALPVDLKDHEVARKREVHHVRSDRELELEQALIAGKRVHRADLVRPRPRTVDVRNRLRRLRLDAFHVHGVAILHALRVAAVNFGRLFTEAPCPMFLSPLRLASPGVQGGAFSLRSGLYAEAFAGTHQRGLPHAELSLNASHGETLSPVQVIDDGEHRGTAGRIDWSHAEIVSIVEEPAKNRLWNLAVAEDETYLAESLIVHNCRTHTTALTEKEAHEEGITQHPPDVKAQDGFGRRPAVAGSDWMPETIGYPAEIAEALEKVL